MDVDLYERVLGAYPNRDAPQALVEAAWSLICADPTARPASRLVDAILGAVHAPAGALLVLAVDPRMVARQVALAHPNVPAERLGPLVRAEKNTGVLYAVACNSRRPLLLHELAGRVDGGGGLNLAAALLRNPATAEGDKVTVVARVDELTTVDPLAAGADAAWLALAGDPALAAAAAAEVAGPFLASAVALHVRASDERWLVLAAASGLNPAAGACRLREGGLVQVMGSTLVPWRWRLAAAAVLGRSADLVARRGAAAWLREHGAAPVLDGPTLCALGTADLAEQLAVLPQKLAVAAFGLLLAGAPERVLEVCDVGGPGLWATLQVVDEAAALQVLPALLAAAVGRRGDVSWWAVAERVGSQDLATVLDQVGWAAVQDLAFDSDPVARYVGECLQVLAADPGRARLAGALGDGWTGTFPQLMAAVGACEA